MNIRAKYSGGPKTTAKLASVGANKVRAITLSVPATNEEMAEIARAGPAFPLLGHLVAVNGRRDGGGLPGDVDDDCRRRSPYMAP